MLGGAFAMFHYTCIHRDTKDLDIFCKASEFSGILKFFGDKGFRTELTDVRWLAKIFKGEYFIDIIFDTVNNICRVDDSWYEHATKARFVGEDVLLLPPEELVWCKLYVQNRERYDGADVNHILLKAGKDLDWKRLLFRMDPHWHILLHEVTGEVRKSTLQAHWAQMGFSKFKLVAADQTSRPAHYVAKYISKFQGTRVRASLNYGTPQGVSAVGRSLTKEGRDPVMPDTSRTIGAEGNVEPISDELRRLSQFRRAISELFAGESVSSESVRSDPASRPEGWHGVSPPPGGQGVGPVAVGRAEQSKRDSVPRSCRSKAARSNYASARSGALSLATLVKLGP